MNMIGYMLLICGFLAAAFATAHDVEMVHWTPFISSAVAAFVGLIMVKRHQAYESTTEAVLASNRNELTQSIDNLQRELNALIAGGKRGEQLAQQIDDSLRDDLRRFADARESMVHLFGLQVYADIMSGFAAGERYINRVWSASIDGYEQEARDYLDKAARQFEQASKQLHDAAAAVG